MKVVPIQTRPEPRPAGIHAFRRAPGSLPNSMSRLAITLLLASLLHPVAQAIVVIGSGDPGHNTTAPTGTLAGSGWQWQGVWEGLAGTAIAPDFLITAAHAGGGVGRGFQYRGKYFIAVASYLAPDADLRLWRVAGTLPDFAPRYTGSAEMNKGIVLFGLGGPRGDLVTASAGAGKKLKGWLWGNRDGYLRWGTNTVSQIVAVNGANVAIRGGTVAGDLLMGTFDSAAGNEEATVTDGDSGGGVFILEAGKWKLAGIIRAVEGHFRTTANDGEFSAALFDKGGFYQFNGANWELIPAQAFDLPTAFYATRISGSADWIDKVLAGSIAADSTLSVESSDAPDGPFVADSEVRLDVPTARFVAPLGRSARYYRLVPAGYNFTGAAVEGGNLILKLSE